LISAIDFSRRLSRGGKIWRINGPARTTKSVASIQESEGCSTARVEWAISNQPRHKSVVNAALQNGKVTARIKMALTH
jgi:hypothetical protein